MHNHRTLEFQNKSALIRSAIGRHKQWIEQKLGHLADAVIFEIDLDLGQIGIERILDCSSGCFSPSRAIRRLRPLVATSEIPEIPPLIEISKGESKISSKTQLIVEGQQRQSLCWEDCPLALKLYTVSAPIVLLNIAFYEGPSSPTESSATILICKRECTEQVLFLLRDLSRRGKQPRLHTMRGSVRDVPRCDWKQVVLAPEATSLLKNDFESFFEREAWFREKGLPFRRGYLLHGPPGNGKTTAIRAMLTSRGLTAFTMRFFDADMDDSALEYLFDTAVKERPAMVLLEDIDRAFPKTGETKSRISLQALLNCLDGVGTGEGIIVVATANEPAILDPAILKRPGRFDRVVCFPNPDVSLRSEYLRLLNPDISLDHLGEAIRSSDGFSFAQLREAYIIAGQRAFERQGTIEGQDLLVGIETLRQGISAVGRKGGTGF